MSKTLKYSIDIQGTDAEAKEMGKLTSEINNLKRSLQQLKKVEKEQGALTQDQSRERAKLQTQLKGTQNAYRDLEAQVLKNNDALRKNSGFVAGVQKGMQAAIGTLAKISAAYFALQGAVRALNKLNSDAIKLYNEDRKAAIVFGDSLGYVTRQAKANANAIGLTRREYISAAAATQDLLVPLGLSRQRASEFSTELTNLSGALSLWDTKQRSSSEISEILTKALLGEAEQAKSLGILIDQSSPAFNERIKQMMETEKVSKEQAKAMDILNQITQKTSDAQDNFADSTENMGLKQAQATARLKESYETFVESILPALNKLTTFTTDLLDAISGTIDASDRMKSVVDRGYWTDGLIDPSDYQALLDYTIGLEKMQREAESLSVDGLKEKIFDLSAELYELDQTTEVGADKFKLLESVIKELQVTLDQKISDNYASEMDRMTKSNETATLSTEEQLKALDKLIKKRQEAQAQADQDFALYLEHLRELQSEDSNIIDAFNRGLSGSEENDILLTADSLFPEEEVDDSIYKMIEKQTEAAEKTAQLWDDAFSTVRNSLVSNLQTAIQDHMAFQQENIDRQTQIEIDMLNARMERGLITEEQFQKERENIERKALRKKKDQQRKQAIMNTALAITSALATVQPTVPAGIAAAAAAGLAGAVQLAQIEAQSFAEGGFTGDGYGRPDKTGYRQAGVVHENEYVVPEKVLNSKGGARLVDELEAMRQGRRAMVDDSFMSGKPEIVVIPDSNGGYEDLILAVNKGTKTSEKGNKTLTKTIKRVQKGYYY